MLNTLKLSQRGAEALTWHTRRESWSSSETSSLPSASCQQLSLRRACLVSWLKARVSPVSASKDCGQTAALATLEHARVPATTKWIHNKINAHRVGKLVYSWQACSKEVRRKHKWCFPSHCDFIISELFISLADICYARIFIWLYLHTDNNATCSSLCVMKTM